MAYDRLLIEHGNNIFYFISFRLVVVEIVHNASVETFRTERNEYPETNLYLALQFFRNAVGEGAV